MYLEHNLPVYTTQKQQCLNIANSMSAADHMTKLDCDGEKWHKHYILTWNNKLTVGQSDCWDYFKHNKNEKV